ncbi:MAG: hypothetical protein Ta2A_12080 [Treponemataceae bacterium]|nr:MAG: hypothetical protein Ta2A_12080 [Treponemataceae bacterium]
MIFIDLFSGIGGFAYGAWLAGMKFEAHYYSEVDDYANKVYQQRFPYAIPLGGIRNIRAADLPKGEYILAGGFPCQDISFAGKGAGLAGERSGLFYEYARLLREIRPRYAIMENVGALIIRGMDAVLREIYEAGYDAEWCDIRASDVGAPHRRERIWVVAYPKSNRQWKNVHQSSGDRTSVIKKPNEWGRLWSISYRDGALYNWKTNESILTANNDGLPGAMDAVRLAGNAIVPQIAALIFAQIRQDAGL